MIPNEVVVIAEEIYEEFDVTSEESIEIAWSIYNKLQFCSC